MMRWKTRRLVSIAGTTPPSPGVGQHHRRGGFGHVRRVGHGYPRFGLAQRRSIVDAVPAHPDHLAATLEASDQPELVFRKHAGKNAAVKASPTRSPCSFSGGQTSPEYQPAPPRYAL